MCDIAELYIVCIVAVGILESVTLDDIKAFAAQILKDNNRTLVVMRPEAVVAE